MIWRDVVRQVDIKISERFSVSVFRADSRYQKTQYKYEISDSCYELLGTVKS